MFMDMCLGDKNHQGIHRDSCCDSSGGGYPGGAIPVVIGRGRKGICEGGRKCHFVSLMVVNREPLIINA